MRREGKERKAVRKNRTMTLRNRGGERGGMKEGRKEGNRRSRKRTKEVGRI